MAARKATGGARNKLAVILSGNAARAAAHLGGLVALEEAGLAPALVVGVSGGAVAGALYAATGDAVRARDELYRLVQRYSWQDLCDLDYLSLVDLPARPYEVNGLVRGSALLKALLESAVGRKGFGQLETELFVLATDLNSGREVVFCAQTASELGERPPYRVYAESPEDLAAVNVAAACRASCAVPGLFEPLSLRYLCLVDGSLRLRKALDVALAQDGVKRVLWLHAGLDENDNFSLVTDYAGQSIAAGLLQALTVASADAFDPHCADPALEGVALRYVNLATSGIGAAELNKAQQLVESGRRTLAAVLGLEVCEGGKGLFTAPKEEIRAALESQVDATDGPRWAVTIGAGGRDVLAITDLMPPVQQEFGYEFDDYLKSIGAEPIRVAEPTATADWARAQAEEELGLSRLCATAFSRFLAYAWRGLGMGLRTACSALALDLVWQTLIRTVEQAALALSDALVRDATEVASTPASTAPAPAEPASSEETAESEPVAEASGGATEGANAEAPGDEPAG